MATIMVVSKPFDEPTSYGYHYLKRFSKFATKHGHTVIFLKSATLSNLHETIAKYDPRLIIINGHGGRKGVELNSHVLLGVVDYDPELGKKIHRQNPEICAGRIVLLLTCNTGKELAFRLIDYGADAVMAFKDPFIFLSQEHHVNPAYDKLAEPFFISMLQGALHLVRGETFGYACNSTRKAFAYYRDLMEQKRETLSAKYLHFDLVNLVCLGDMSVTL